MIIGRVISFNQLIMSKQYQTIHREFLDPTNYQFVSKNSANLNQKYGQLCELFKKEFLILRNDKIQLSGLNRGTTGLSFDRQKHKFQFISELFSFINDFQKVLKQMASYQISCLERLKESSQPELEITSRIVEIVKKNKAHSQELEQQRNLLIQTYAQIKKTYTAFCQIIKNPAVYYQSSLITKMQHDLKEKMAKDWKLMSQILAKRQKCQEMIERFDPYLSAFRKALIKNKYNILKKLAYLIKNTKTATIQLFDALRNCAINRRKIYLEVIELKSDDINYLKAGLKQIRQPDAIVHYTEENKEWEKNTSRSINQFQEAFDQIENIVSQLISFFNNFCNKCYELHQNFRTLTLQLNQYFEQAQSPYRLMKQLLDVQVHFSKKIGNIVLKLQQIENKLRLQKNSCKKQAEMLLTIIKVNKNNHKSFLESFNKNKELDQLVQKISFQPTKMSLISLYDEFINLQDEILNNLNLHPLHKKPTYDSMDISHTLGEFKYADKKVPLKEEYWLWRQYKSQIEINFEYINEYFKSIENHFQKIIGLANVKDSTTLQQHKCILIEEKKEVQGTIELKINSFEFTDYSIRVSVPWKEIISIQIQNKVWKDILIVQTAQGRLQFYKIENIEAVMNQMKDTQEKSMMGKKKKIQKKPAPHLTEAALATIEQRKSKIQSQIPNLKDFIPLVQDTFQNYRIDEIYQIFYSDKGFNFYGKEEPCFFSYTGKKLGNYNWQAQKYDKPGPEFYTQDSEVTFENCPLFSERKISYNHPMKPSAIPFMPKFCLNSDHRKMYWISHEQLLYLIDSVTEGVPYADCFLVSIAHRIKKVENGTKVEISMYIKWVKDTIMKSTIEGNVIPEVTQNMKNFFLEANKVLKLMTSLQKGEDVEIPIEAILPESENKDNPPDQLSKVKLHNKILIIAFVLLVLFNLLHVIFS